MSAPERVTADTRGAGHVAADADAGRREHALRSLLELGYDLTTSGDLHATADLLLFNLMGQLSVARSALWLVPDEVDAAPVLVRSHGFRRQVLLAAFEPCREHLDGAFGDARQPAHVRTLPGLPPAPHAALMAAGVEVFAPLTARGERVGWLALGARLNGRAYEASDLTILSATLGLVGSALQNARLYNRMLESNRRQRETIHRLNELDRMKSEFIANVNHELRTPLTIVLGTLESLAEHDAMAAPARRLLASAHVKTRDLAAMVENLLRFADEMHARVPVRLESLDAGPLVTTWCADRQPGVVAGLRELRLVIEPGTPPVRADRERVLQVLNELVDNVGKFTPRGTRIDVRVARGTNAGAGADHVSVTVADDGPGIPADRMEALFEWFEQVDGSSTRAVGGLGMGLALARRLAERMGCRLDAASTPGSGACFTLLMPVDRTPALG